MIGPLEGAVNCINLVILVITLVDAACEGRKAVVATQILLTLVNIGLESLEHTRGAITVYLPHTELSLVVFHFLKLVGTHSKTEAVRITRIELLVRFWLKAIV